MELIRTYLQSRARLGLPMLLLVDGAGWQTRLWPQVAQECLALGIRVLVAVRNEDWFRFAQEGLVGYEVLDPTLELEEARQIFASLKGQRRIHSSVDSPEWAYERIGEPHLLIEYVYLITHGRMLEDRLHDQLGQFAKQHEDPTKIEILRRVSLADTLGTPVVAEALLENLTLRDDPQQILRSLAGEYLRLESGILKGLHWVRSDHLTRLLHEGFPNPARTALAILDAIPLNALATFVSGALHRQDINQNVLYDGLIEKAKQADLPLLLALLEGFFAGGERQFFTANQSVFDQAYTLFGPSGAFLLKSAVLPVVKTSAVEQLASLFPENQSLQALQELAAQIQCVPRGLDLCRDFLTHLLPHLNLQINSGNLSETGQFLDWCGLCEVQLPDWSSLRDAVFSHLRSLDMPLDVFCACTQGLYRCGATAFQHWFVEHQNTLLSYLQLHTTAAEMRLDDSVLSIEFLLAYEDGKSPHDQTMSRLYSLRSAIPFCHRYQSQAIWFLPFDLKLSHDATFKDMPSSNLHFTSDISKNVIWSKLVELSYLPDSSYRYQEAWHSLRQEALLFIQILGRGLQRTLVGKAFDFSTAFEQGALLERLRIALKNLPDPPPSMLPAHQDLLKGSPKEWSSHLNSFFQQFLHYFGDKQNTELHRLIAHNFSVATKLLSDMQSAFTKVFLSIPDYFNASTLDKKEVAAYSLLADLIDPWLLNPPNTRPTDIVEYVRIRKARARQEVVHRLKSALAGLQSEGMTFVMPADVFLSPPLRYLALGYSVANPAFPEVELGVTLEALSQLNDVTDFFCLVPLYQEAPFLDEGYQVSTEQLNKMMAGQLTNWESLIPRALPEGALRSLRLPPKHPREQFQLRAGVLALLGIAQSFGRLYGRLQSMENIDNPFLRTLAVREQALLQSRIQELAAGASRIQTQLTDAFPHLQADPDMRLLEQFLFKIAAIAQSKEFAVLQDVKIDKLSRALDQVMRR